MGPSMSKYRRLPPPCRRGYILRCQAALDLRWFRKLSPPSLVNPLQVRPIGCQEAFVVFTSSVMLAEVKKANLSAAEALKAELAASMGDDDDEASPVEADKPTE